MQVYMHFSGKAGKHLCLMWPATSQASNLRQACTKVLSGTSQLKSVLLAQYLDGVQQCVE